jgi:hypothetical protein
MNTAPLHEPKWFRRHGLTSTTGVKGRCPLLVWFTRSERILSPAELAAALDNYHREADAA